MALGFYVRKVTPPDDVGAWRVIDGSALGLGPYVRDGTALGLGLLVVVVPDDGSGGVYVRFT